MHGDTMEAARTIHLLQKDGEEEWGQDEEGEEARCRSQRRASTAGCRVPEVMVEVARVCNFRRRRTDGEEEVRRSHRRRGGEEAAGCREEARDG